MNAICHHCDRKVGREGTIGVCQECAELYPLRSEPLFAAAIAVREYLESTEVICCSKFDIPDAVWVPFCKAIDTANAHALAEERSDDSQQRVVGTLNQEDE